MRHRQSVDTKTLLRWRRRPGQTAIAQQRPRTRTYSPRSPRQARARRRTAGKTPRGDPRASVHRTHQNAQQSKRTTTLHRTTTFHHTTTLIRMCTALIPIAQQRPRTRTYSPSSPRQVRIQWTASCLARLLGSRRFAPGCWVGALLPCRCTRLRARAQRSGHWSGARRRPDHTPAALAHHRSRGTHALSTLPRVRDDR